MPPGEVDPPREEVLEDQCPSAGLAFVHESVRPSHERSPAVTAPGEAVEGAVTGVLAAEVEHRAARPRALEEHLGRQRLEDRSVVPDGVQGQQGDAR